MLVILLKLLLVRQYLDQENLFWIGKNVTVNLLNSRWIQDKVYRGNPVYRGGLKTAPIQDKYQDYEKKKS